MKLASSKAKKSNDPSELLSSSVSFDTSYFETHNVFASNIIGDDFYLVPACGIDTMKILKIENCRLNNEIVAQSDRKFNSEEAMEFLSNLLNNGQLELVSLDSNLIKNESRQIVFKAI